MAVKRKKKKKTTKSKEKIQKVVFLDSNIFINCALEEVEGSNIETLGDIESLLNKNKAKLLLPEVVISEVEFGIEDRFIKLRLKIKKSFDSILKLKELDPSALKKGRGKSQGLLIKSLKEVRTRIRNDKKEALKNLDDKKKEIKRAVSDIVKNSNAIKIDLSDNDIMKGLRRSLNKKPPFSVFNNKPAYLKDSDCIIFESLISFLKEYKATGKVKIGKLILCIDDVDYFKSEDKQDLKKEVEQDLKKEVEQLKAYNDPVEMLKGEFHKKYTSAEIKKHKEIKKSVTSREGLMKSLGVIRDSLMSSELKNAGIVSEATINKGFGGAIVDHGIRAVRDNFVADSAVVSDGYSGAVLNRGLDFSYNCRVCGKDLSGILIREYLEQIVYEGGLAGQRIFCPDCGAINVWGQ